jgi:Ca-activated chloride channel family protein
LAEKDFEVYEDGVKQAIQLFRSEDVPVTVGLVIDHSGSMHRKLADVIEAARTFIRFSNVEDEMFVVNFNDRVSFGLPAGIKFSNNSDKLAAAISSMPSTGKTSLYDATVKARERLNYGSREKKALILISDGGDNASRNNLAEVLNMLEESSALVYTIGIFDEDDPDKNPAVLRRLARVTGGEAFFPQQLSEVSSICERIARDIRSRYTIGYMSRNVAAPGTFRAIRLVAHSAGKRNLSVRTRSGYIAADEPSLAKSPAAK